MSDVENRKFDRVVVHKIGFLTPSLKGLSSIMMRMDYGACALVAASQALDTSTPSGRRNVFTRTRLARFELHVKREKLVLRPVQTDEDRRVLRELVRLWFAPSQ